MTTEAHVVAADLLLEPDVVEIVAVHVTGASDGIPAHAAFALVFPPLTERL
jgi:hypothetical protein